MLYLKKQNYPLLKIANLEQVSSAYGNLPESIQTYLAAEGMSPELAFGNERVTYKKIKVISRDIRVLCQNEFKECDLCGKCQEECQKVSGYLNLISDRK